MAGGTRVLNEEKVRHSLTEEYSKFNSTAEKTLFWFMSRCNIPNI